MTRAAAHLPPREIIPLHRSILSLVAPLLPLVALGLVTPGCASEIVVPLDPARYCAAAGAIAIPLVSAPEATLVENCIENFAAAHQTAEETGCTESLAALLHCVETTPQAPWCSFYRDLDGCGDEQSAFSACVASGYAQSLCGRAGAAAVACGFAGDSLTPQCLRYDRCEAQCTVTETCAAMWAEANGSTTPNPDPYCGPVCGMPMD